MNNKIITIQEIPAMRAANSGARIVHCHGVFDILHIGHLLYFNEAKSFGDLLVVSVTSDEFVKKGPGRPRFGDAIRCRMLAALDVIDYVVPSPFETAETIIAELEPDFYVKGPDYTIRENDQTGNILREEKAVLEHGGQLKFTNGDTDSSTSIINSYLSQFNSEQSEAIAQIREKYSIQDIEELIDKIAELSVLVVGEPIIDSYIFCKPENISSKSPSISANYQYQDDYAGGSWAVARHLAELGCSVELIAPRGKEKIAEYCEGLVLDHANIKLSKFAFDNLPTPHKTRFVEPTFNQRMFELTNLDFEKWHSADLDQVFARLSELSEKADATLALDFGHGLWGGTRLLQNLNLGNFVSMNVQTNSGNQGFNLFNKHQGFQFLTLDERELRLGLGDRVAPVHELIHRLATESSLETFAVTVGRNGSYVIDGDKMSFTPNFSGLPVDTTGAGDAYFSIASLLRSLNCDPVIIGFLGNIYAGLKTQIIGNKEPVKTSDLKKSIKAILTI